MNGPTNNDPKFEGAGKMIGGFATENLSPSEKEALFSAALRDQDLFDALMDEQALKDLLEEPGVKGELIESLQPKLSLLDRVKSFLATPVAWGTMGAVATAALLLVVILPSRQAPTTNQTAQVQRQEMRRDEPATPTAARPQIPLPAPVAQPPAATPPRNEANPASRPEPPQEQSLAKEQAKREQVQVQSAPAQAVQTQERDRQQEAPRLTSPVPQPVRIPEQQQQPVPAAAVGGVAQLLAIDYALLRRAPDGSFQTATTVRSGDALRVQVMVSETGMVSLYRKTPEGLMSPVAAAQRVTRGQVTQIPQQGSIAASDGSFVLVLSRDSASTDQVTTSAPGATGQGFRQNAGEMRAKRAASAAQAPAAAAPPGALLDSSARKAVLPSASLGRAAASSPEDRIIAVEFTIHAEN